MFKNQLKCIVTWLWTVTLLVPAWPPMAAAQEPTASAPQTQSLSTTPQDQAARIDQMFQECEELIKKARYDELANKAEEALRLSRTLDDKNRMARALNYLGAAYFYRGRMKEAQEAFKQVAAVAGEAGNKKLQAFALNNVGNVLRNFGQYEEALDFLTRSLSLQRELGHRVAEAQALRNIGILYTDLGDYDKAEPTIQDALRLAREVKNKLFEQASLMNLAVVEKRRARFQSAIRYFEQALALDPEVNSPGVRSELLNSMAEAYWMLGEHQKVIDLSEQSLGLARANGDRLLEAIIIGNMGMGQYGLGQLSEALNSLTSAHTLLRQTGDFPAKEWLIDLSLARVQRALGHNEEALASCREAMAAIERLRASAVPTETSKASVIATRRDVFVETVDLLLSLRREVEALEVAERYRARAFLDLLAESRIDARQDLTQSQRDREDTLFSRISTVQRELWKEGLPAEREQQLKAQLAAAENDLEVFRLELRRTNPRYASVQHPEPLGVERIQRQLLDADTALIEYILGQKQSFAWVVSQKKLTVAVLPPRKEIEAQVAAYRQTLTKKVSVLTIKQALDEFQSQSQKLYEMLLQPLENSLTSNRKLIIVPDGALAYLPFEALISPWSAVRGPWSDAKSQSPKIRHPPPAIRHPKYLLERFTMTYAPSASALAAIKARTKELASAHKKLIAFGDPIYTGEGKSAQERSTTSISTPSVLSFYAERGFNFVRLPYTWTEVTGISRLFSAPERQVYLGSQAREEMVKTEELNEYRYVHFATHGMMHEDMPARSGIVLSLDDTSKEDGVLQMSEIMRLKFNADMVTLSACSTGLGKLFDGEGLIGLTRAFFYAGANSVVVSLWNVNDLATAELMRAFYRNLNRGRSKDEALRQAKLALMKGPQRAWRHPYFWAPFVLVGESH